MIPNRIHFIGIGGAGMSAFAQMMLSRGKRVSGSDREASAATRKLEAMGARIFNCHTAKNILPDVEAVVYTLAIADDNPEFLEAKRRALPLLTYAEFLGRVSRDYCTIAIAGTHGKTSTTGMVARIARDAGLDPTVIVGGALVDFDSNFVGGRGRYFIVEACEYRRSFLQLRPNIAVITNIDDDHLDYYGDLAGVRRGFREFAERIRPGGALVCNPRDPNVAPILAGLSCRVRDYAAHIQPELNLQTPGAHMIRNAGAALAVASVLGIDTDAARKSLEQFRGVRRRFEYKGTTARGADIYDDYAHHPTEIRATLEAAREKFRTQKIHVIFQPHLYSRTKMLLDDFAVSFADADCMRIAPIYAARETQDPEVSAELLARRIGERHPNASMLGSRKEAVEYGTCVGAGDVLFTMGAGDIFTVGDQIVRRVQ